MPDSADSALKGMLAEGVAAEEVLSALSDAGFDVKPPEGDESYDEAPEAEELPGAAGDLIEIASEEPEETEEEEGDYEDKRMDVAKAAMDKHGF